MSTTTPDETLGHVTAPSGLLVLLDRGLMYQWSHTAPPHIPEWAYEPHIVEACNTAVDLRIDGPDAARAGRAFNRQGNPRYLFDIPRRGLAQVQESFEQLVQEAGLRATLLPLAARVPHRERVTLAIQEGGGAGEVFYNGMAGAAVAGLPRDVALPVLGRRMPEGPYTDRWHTVRIECRPDVSVTRTEEVGFVLVDTAGLLAGDADALGEWSEEPLDGLADFVFWGRDAAEVARRFEASAVHTPGESAIFGWKDLPVETCAERGEAVEALRAQGLKFASDFRPHTHQYLAMAQVRASPSESGEVTVGGARMCLFMTTWGDGAYQVTRELGADGTLVRICLELGSEQIVERQRKLERPR